MADKVTKVLKSLLIFYFLCNITDSKYRFLSFTRQDHFFFLNPPVEMLTVIIGSRFGKHENILNNLASTSTTQDGVFDSITMSPR